MIYIFHLFVSYITYSVSYSFFQITSRHHLQDIWSFPTELRVAALVGADYWRWNGLIAQFGLLWKSILSFRPAGRGGMGGIVMGWLLFLFLPYFNLTLLFSILLANVHRFYCCLFGGKLPLGMCWYTLPGRKSATSGKMNWMPYWILTTFFCGNFYFHIIIATSSGGYTHQTSTLQHYLAAILPIFITSTHIYSDRPATSISHYNLLWRLFSTSISLF